MRSRAWPLALRSHPCPRSAPFVVAGGALAISIALCIPAHSSPTGAQAFGLSASQSLPFENPWSADGGQAGAGFAFRLAAAGDVNGDGFDDVVIGAPWFDMPDTNEGRVTLYLGSPGGLHSAPAWIFEGNQLFAGLGYSVASAGDVNGDGFDDVIIGAVGYSNPQRNEGAAFLFLGSSVGLPSSPAWTVEGGQAGADFGWDVAGAGDVNGDGFDDVLVGAPWYTNDQGAEGRAYLYLGSSTGLAVAPAWMAEGDQVNARFGLDLAGAGDVNGDGFADVIVGSPNYASPYTWEGRAYVYLGSATGLATTATWFTEGDQDFALYGDFVSAAGDVNRDGFGDILVGSPWYSNTHIEEGRAFLFLGSPAGPSHAPAWTLDGQQASCGLGVGIGTAGDVNRDGYADVLVGAPGFDGQVADIGRAWLFFGSDAGLDSVAAWTVEGDSLASAVGRAVSTAGDTNGDGIPEFLVGGDRSSYNFQNEGRAWLYRIAPSSAAAPSLIQWDIIDGRLHLLWNAGTSLGPFVKVERCDDGVSWADIGDAAVGGSGLAEFVDSAIESGRRYGYRLRYMSSAGEQLTPDTWITIPSDKRGFRFTLSPNPVRGPLLVSFDLVAAGSVDLAIYDIRGAIRWQHKFGRFDAGHHAFQLDAIAQLPAGRYLVCMLSGHDRVVRPIVVVR